MDAQINQLMELRYAALLSLAAFILTHPEIVALFPDDDIVIKTQRGHLLPTVQTVSRNHLDLGPLKAEFKTEQGA